MLVTTPGGEAGEGCGVAGKQGKCSLNSTWGHLTFLLLHYLPYSSDLSLESLYLEGWEKVTRKQYFEKQPMLLGV